jgi:hypothetical protein
MKWLEHDQGKSRVQSEQRQVACAERAEASRVCRASRTLLGSGLGPTVTDLINLRHIVPSSGRNAVARRESITVGNRNLVGNQLSLLPTQSVRNSL